jgi:feruloyl-CoA synthase
LTEGDQEAVLASSEVIEAIRQGLSEHNAEHSGSSQRVERFLLLDEPPSVGDGEITEKGYVNQGLVQRRRNVWVRALYATSDIAVWPV